MSKQKKILYFHIPKTAGTTVANLLDKHCKKTIHHIESKSISNDFLSQFEAVSGHVTYTAMKNILDLSKWTTIATFREPYSYVVSHLCWVRKLADEGEENRFLMHQKHFQDMALKMKMLDLGNYKDINKLVSYLKNVNLSYFFNTQTLYMDTSKRLNFAINNMRTVNIIGLTEFMDDLVKQIDSYFNYPLIAPEPKILNKNSNKYGLDITDTKIRNSLYPLINKDLYLYEEAVRLADQ